jgi:anaerobic selenocysteine-containing dehydrogenase
MKDRTSEWKSTACILCECNCGIEVQIGEDGRSLSKIRGDKNHPVSLGYTCEKPSRLDFYQNGRDRVLKPLRRRPDGGFEEIDWETAIREVAERLSRVRDDHGGEAIFYYGGGGQGNHLPGSYATATRRALGSRYRSSALAQEKTGQFWVSERMLGAYTRGDFEHCEVAFFLGKNPWYSHSIPRARVVLKEIAKDPARKMIVVDPRRTRTAELADIHLQVRPGCDAWLVAAMVAILIDEDLVDHDFVAAHTSGFDSLREAFAGLQIAAFCESAGVPERLAREATRIIGRAASVASFEDLGVQMNRHSTLVSYLHHLLWLLTGNFGKPGTQYVPTPLLAFANGKHKRDTPVTGERIIGGLVPCNVIPDEILTDHDRRFRAMIVESANPAHSLADSPRMRKALQALDTLVVIDVAMTETARLADYVLPASTQYEKAEATFFNFDFPANCFHLRRAILGAPEGPLPEAEIHARLVEALVPSDRELIDSLREAAGGGTAAYTAAFASRVTADPRLMAVAPVLLYRTLGPALPEGLAEGSVLLGLALRLAIEHSDSLARAGFAGGPITAAAQLFDTILEKPSGIVFAVDSWDHVLDRIGTDDGKIHLALDDLLEEIGLLEEGPAESNQEFPFTLAAGERRAYTANTIIRDPRWRRKGAEGALRINPDDASSLGVETGQQIRLTTEHGSVMVPVEVSDTMQRGNISLPNGTGLERFGGEPQDDDFSGGVAPNELTSTDWRDRFVGTPWHKIVPARLDRLE